MVFFETICFFIGLAKICEWFCDLVGYLLTKLEPYFFTIYESIFSFINKVKNHKNGT